MENLATLSPLVAVLVFIGVGLLFIPAFVYSVMGWLWPISIAASDKVSTQKKWAYVPLTAFMYLFVMVYLSSYIL